MGHLFLADESVPDGAASMHAAARDMNWPAGWAAVGGGFQIGKLGQAARTGGNRRLAEQSRQEFLPMPSRGLLANHEKGPFRRSERAMLRFLQMQGLQKFASVHSSVHNHVSLTAPHHRFPGSGPFGPDEFRA